MAEAKRVLLIGLDPAVVDYGRWPGLTAEMLEGALGADVARLGELGYDASLCFVDRGETAVARVEEVLRAGRFDAILIGAGVRTDAEHFLLFEALVNAVHAAAPAAKLCFNTGPTDSVEAVRRWV